MNKKHALVSASLGAALAATPGLHAQTNNDIDRLQQQLDQQQQTLDAQQRALAETRQQLQRLRLQAQVPPGKTAATPAEGPTAGDDVFARTEHQPVGRAPSSDVQAKNAADQVAPVMEQPGILTPKGHFTLEPSLEYNYATNNRATLLGFTVLPAIVVGLIDVRKVNRRMAIAGLSARYGITDRLEADIKVPYVYGRERSVMRPLDTGATSDAVFSASAGHIGDIEAGLRYQFNKGGPNSPYFIGSLRGSFPTGRGPFEVSYANEFTDQDGITGQPLPTQLPTGSGFYGLQTGVQMIYPSDPAVLFAGANYMHNFSRSFDKSIGGERVGKVNPGNIFDMSFGMGLALNERTSFSMGYKHTYIGKTSFKGQIATNATSTQLGQLQFGVGYRLTPKTNLNLNVGVGITEDAPDVAITLRLPVSF